MSVRGLPAQGLSPPQGDVALAEEAISGDQLLSWRRSMLALGGNRAKLDWLLDLAAGVCQRQMQRLLLSPRADVLLKRPRGELEVLWRRHLEGAVPLQHLVGRCPWRDLNLYVGRGALIPRQETEMLVELALAPSRLGHPSPELWADLGTGSGCLALALALALPGSQGLAVDASTEALAIASINLVEQGERVHLLCGDWWEPLEPWWGCLDLVVANPPYIPTAIISELDPVVREHEPLLALDGGTDGLEAIRRIIGGAPRALAQGGMLALEHHHDQSHAVVEMMVSAGLQEVRAHSDLEGVPRFAVARMGHPELT